MALQTLLDAFARLDWYVLARTWSWGFGTGGADQQHAGLLSRKSSCARMAAAGAIEEIELTCRRAMATTPMC